MKVLDVRQFQDGVHRYVTMLNRLESEMKEIESAIKTISEMNEELKGKGGSAIRSFYAECHLPFLQFFVIFKDNFESILSSMHDALHALESNPSGFIREQFLQIDVRDGLEKIGNKTEALTNEANSYINSVADIVALPKVEDNGVQSGVIQSHKNRIDTVIGLDEFDSSQIMALSEVQDKITKMDTWISDIESLVADGLTNIDFPAEQWKAYASSTGLQKDLEGSGQTVGKKPEDKEKDEGNDYWGMATTSSLIAKEARASFRLFRARGGLVTEQYKGKYRIYATQDALRKLGINPTPGAKSDFMYKLPKDMSKWKPEHHQLFNHGNKTLLKAADVKPGDNGWSAIGDSVMVKNEHLLNWNKDAANATGKAKIVGKAALKGTVEGFTDIVNAKGIVQAIGDKDIPNIAVKGLAPLAAIGSYANNYSDAKKDGLKGADVHQRAILDTTIDTAISSGVQATATALGTALIPIPGVGTAVGVGVGIVANWALNKKWGDSKESAMDKIKGWFR